jgi:hypothetical protein
MQGRKTNILQELEQAIKKKALDRQLSRESAQYYTIYEAIAHHLPIKRKAITIVSNSSRRGVPPLKNRHQQ